MIRKVVTIFGILALMGSSVWAQQADTTRRQKTRQLNEVQVSTARASQMTALTTSTLRKKDIDEKKTEMSVPRILELEPSVVASGEQGIVGNTSMRIRGIDAARINVNINGITLNDAESQSVFWVNIPNLAGMAQSIQIQRGVTAAQGGSAAFGGAVNLQTLNGSFEPYATADVSLGSWNTRQYGITAGTGLMKGGFAVDVAYNGLTSDGYIRNGFCDHQSLFMSASRYGEKSLLKAIVIIGKQKTGITWNGAYAEDLDNDPTYNDAGAYWDDLGNVYFYGNETDNYNQRHYQLYYTYTPTSSWVINSAFDFTHGDGYYENYKDNKKISKYGLFGNENAMAKSDYITRKEMLNSAYTLTANAKYTHNKVAFSFGGTGLYYDGDHFGDLVWAQDASNLFIDEALTQSIADNYDTYEFYRNKGVKKDLTGFARMDYEISRNENLYLDLQYRHVNYNINGSDDDYATLIFDENYNFFNPKAGWNKLFGTSERQQRIYAVAGVSGREPTRADIKDAVNSGDTIKGERMLDIELGYQFSAPRFQASVNGYAMLYKDQLTASGRISESGYALMENVDKSYRLGIELQAGYKVTDWMTLEGNATLSTNKVKDFVYTYYDENWESQSMNLGTTDLSFSPNVVGAGIATFRPFATCSHKKMQNFKFQVIGKYVGEMYCDNTSREEMKQDDYFLLNLRAAYTWNLKSGNQVEAQFVVNNVLNHTYRTNAWVSDAWNPETHSFDVYRAYFQQPGLNWAARLVVRL